MQNIILILCIVLALLLGGICGYAIATESLHQEAVANGMGRWVPASSVGVTFAWGSAPRN